MPALAHRFHQTASMHLGSSRWTYPLMSAAVCMAALLSPWLLGRTVLGPLFLGGALLVAAAMGFLIGEREDALRALASLDPLTGVSNRRHFDDRLKREVAVAQRDKVPLALLVIDLDDLTGINDALGHPAGDRALLAVTEAIKHSCRPTDLVARWGGDELVVVAPCTTGEQARALAERIASTVRLRSADRRTVVELGAPVKSPVLSVSIGIAWADAEHPGGLTPDALFAQADHALLAAKDEGAGAVMVAGESEPRRHALKLVARGA